MARILTLEELKKSTTRVLHKMNLVVKICKVVKNHSDIGTKLREINTGNSKQNSVTG